MILKNKGICKSCLEKCHIGHQTRIFSLNHNATWYLL